MGALFVLMGLSGSILAFRQAIDERLNARLMQVQIPEQSAYRPLDEILTAAKAVAPMESLPERLTMPRHEGLAASVTFIAMGDDGQTDAYEVLIDPYRAKVTGQRVLMHGDRRLSQPLIRILMDFHWTLLLGPNKAYLIGIAAMFLFVSLIAGLYLWWPRNGNWRQALTVKWNATPERITQDLHKAIGLYLCIALMMSLFTGMAMIFKPQTRALVGLMSRVRQEPQNAKSRPLPGRPPISLDAAVAAANAVFPDGRLHWILLPASPKGVYTVGKQADSEPNRSITNRNVAVDQYSGAVLHVEDRENYSAGERFLEWLYPLHCGEAFGNPGRALISIIGLAPLALFTTGFLRWRQRRGARKAGREVTFRQKSASR